ncbi:MAG: sigma-E processing peptidase SpoIIGA [Clostridia bacterium]|nr:sigma-E processing peptidase SpoIIGA [Clostridia bacterium]
MTVYLDVVMLENLCMNYIILFATGYLMKIKMKQLRLIVSSILGGIYAVIAYLEILPIYSSFGMKVVLSILMVYIAFKPKGVKILSKQLIIFYLTSFVFGGCAFALLYFVKPQDILMRNGVYVGTYPIKIALLGGIVGFIITYIAFRIVKNKLRRKDILYNIEITLQEKRLKVKAMLDTGNLLKDPISKMPVIVVEKEQLYSLLPIQLLDHIEEWIGGDEKFLNQIEEKELIARFRIIPFSSVGKQNGLMLGFKADQVEIEKEEDIQVRKDVIIGIFNQKLSKDKRYSALIGLDLLEERGENNELITNSKG